MTNSYFLAALVALPLSLAIVLTGLILLCSAGILSFALLRHRGPAEMEERIRRIDEIESLRTALHAELLTGARATVLATSTYNRVTTSKTSSIAQTYFNDPIIFRSLAYRIGLLDDVTLVGAIAGFYENLVHFVNRDMQADTDAEGTNYRLRLMCYNLALALEEFGVEAAKIPSDLKATDLWDRNGASIWDGATKPATLIELLRVL